MTEDILNNSRTFTPSVAVPKKKKNRVSFMAAILGIFLAAVLIIFGERVLFDLNRSFNPVIVDQQSTAKSSSKSSVAIDDSPSLGYASERSALSSSRVYYPREKSSEYKMYRLMIHSAFVIPVFLLTFVVYFWIWHKKQDDRWKVIVVGYLVFGFWMMLHLIFEVGGFVLSEYKNIGVYLVLVFLAAIFTWLMVVLQKRVNKKDEPTLPR